MSREIGFRAWSKKHNRYLKITGIQYDGDKLAGVFVVYGVIAGIPNIIFLEPEDIVLEQDTGLKDMNGKMIREGDIVNIQGIKYYVDFEYGGFWLNNDNRKWKANRPFTHFLEINDAEVIGNIHENPELLGGEE